MVDASRRPPERFATRRGAAARRTISSTPGETANPALARCPRFTVPAVKCSTTLGAWSRREAVLIAALAAALRHGAGRITLTARDGEIAVADEGGGFGLEMFERFTRGDEARTRDGGGAGLGLAIVRAIARAHGGDATSDGATVRLRLSQGHLSAPS